MVEEKSNLMKLNPCRSCHHCHVVLVSEWVETGQFFFVKCLNCKKIGPKTFCSTNDSAKLAIQHVRKTWNENQEDF